MRWVGSHSDWGPYNFLGTGAQMVRLTLLLLCYVMYGCMDVTKYESPYPRLTLSWVMYGCKYVSPRPWVTLS